MTHQRLRGVTFGIALLAGLSLTVAGCDGLDRPRPVSPLTPSPAVAPEPQPAPAVTLYRFTERATGFSTTDLHDAQEQVLQLNDSTTELIWGPDGTRIPGYALSPNTGLVDAYFVTGKICPEGCDFEVRFGSRSGERRAYLTVDYGHNNPGTVVDVEVVNGSLVVTQTDRYPPGTPTLSGVVTEITPAGPVPVEGASVYRGVTTGWREGFTDAKGYYRIAGLIDGSEAVVAMKDGYQDLEQVVTIKGDTQLDIQLARR